TAPRPTPPYTLSLHDALPISAALKPLVMAIPAIKSRRGPRRRKPAKLHADKAYDQPDLRHWVRDRGSKVCSARKGLVGDGGRPRSEGTRLNSSHRTSSYAVFC